MAILEPKVLFALAPIVLPQDLPASAQIVSKSRTSLCFGEAFLLDGILGVTLGGINSVC